jgi:hypothetical protein
MLAMDPRWLYLDLWLLSSGQKRASASVAAPYFSFIILTLYGGRTWLAALTRPKEVSRR